MGQSSISDINSYSIFCKNAASTDLFNNFRSHPFYQNILEHVTFDIGLKYLSIIQNDNPKILNNIEDYIKNDTIGSPNIFNYDIGKISPSTLRYIKVLSDIINIYNSLDNKNVVGF